MKSSTRISPLLRVYTGMTWLLAIAALAWSIQEGAVKGGLGWDGFLAAVSLVLFVAVAGAMPLALTPKVKVSVGAAPLFAATLLFAPPIAACIGLAGSLASHGYLQSRRRRTWFDTVFNAGRTVLQITLAGMLFHALSGGRLWPAAGGDHVLPAVLVGGLVYYAVNAATVYGAAAINLRQDAALLWWSTARVEAPQQAALLLFGFITALVANAYPILGLAMILPVGVVYYSLRGNLALRAQTHTAVEAMADAVDLRVYGVYGHSQRVAELSATLATQLGMSRDEIELVRQAARVHDIGKVAVSVAVLTKPAPWTVPEREEVAGHVELGAEILGRFPEYQRCRQLVRLHHERPDGKGYPEGRREPHIPLGAAIIGVAEAFVAFTSERADREPMTAAQACAELRSGAGAQYPAAVVQALLAYIQWRDGLAADAVAADAALRAGT